MYGRDCGANADMVRAPTMLADLSRSQTEFLSTPQLIVVVFRSAR
jgi:hypothetical protein